MRLSLAMIVRDAAGTLGPCLESIRPWVDEMVVVDTGSVDQTPELAGRLGARVFHFPWCDDFSAARNESLRHCQGEWIFWMDADDTIDPANGRKLRQLADGPHAREVLGYVIQVHCPAKDGSDDYTAVDHVKLFRNLPELHFEGRIHEQVLPAIRQAGGEVAWTDLYVTHSGSDQSPEGKKRKYDRDLRILYLDLHDRPDHPFVLFNLGMTYADMGRHEEAVGRLRRSIAVAQPTESHLRKAYALLVSSLQQLDQHAEAEAVCRRGLDLFPEDAELLFRQAMLAHEAGRLDEAAWDYRQVLVGRRDRYFSSIDRGIAGAKARHNLACVYADMERPDLAEIQWRRILDEAPNRTHARRLLVETLLRQGRLATAELEIARLEQDQPAGPEAFLLRGRLHELRGDLLDAREQFQAAAQNFPDDPAVWECLGRFLFERGKPWEAVEALTRLVQIQPENAAARHNLGMALLRAGHVSDAVESLQASLRLRPDSEIIREQLRQATEMLEREQADESREQQPSEPAEEQVIQAADAAREA